MGRSMSWTERRGVRLVEESLASGLGAEGAGASVSMSESSEERKGDFV